MIVLCLGIIYSCIIHIARSMQRFGIHSFDNIRDRISGNSSRNENQGKHFIYLLGLIITNLCFIFVILAGKFGSTSFFTAMYGVGMLPMLLFTRYVMKEKATLQNWLGVLIIIIGCFFMGIAAQNTDSINMSLVNLRFLVLVLIVIAGISHFIIKWGKKSGHMFKDAMAAGFTAGVIACLDPILKSTGQNFSNNDSLLPAHPIGWLFFLLSFVASTSSLLISQYAYSRRVYASQFLPHYSVAYVTMPVFIQMIILPDYLPGKFEIIGIITIITGIIIFSEKEFRLLHKKLK